MGAYSPAPVVTPELTEQVMRDIVLPTARAMVAEGCPFRGVLFAGLMIKNGRAKLLEHNVRFGDPECQGLMARLGSDLLPVLVAACDGELAEVKLDWKPQVRCTALHHDGLQHARLSVAPKCMPVRACEGSMRSCTRAHKARVYLCALLISKSSFLPVPTCVRMQTALTVVMAAKGYPGAYAKGTPIAGLEAAEAASGAKIFHAGTADGPDGSSLVSAGGRVLGVTALGNDVAAAQTAAYDAVHRVDWADAYYRSDIGWRAVARLREGQGGAVSAPSAA